MRNSYYQLVGVIIFCLKEAPMDDKNETHELIRQVLDVREQIARIDVKLDNIGEVKRIAERADDTAREALSKSGENARDIAEIKADSRRSWGVVIGMAASFIVTVIAYFITRNGG